MKRSIPLAHFLGVLVTVPIAVVASIVANGNHDPLAVGGLVILALIQVGAGIRFRPEDRMITWSPTLMILPVIAAGTFVLGVVGNVAMFSLPWEPTVFTASISWGLAVSSTTGAAVAAWSVTTGDTGHPILFLGSVGWLLLSVSAYWEFGRSSRWVIWLISVVVAGTFVCTLALLHAAGRPVRVPGIGRYGGAGTLAGAAQGAMATESGGELDAHLAEPGLVVPGEPGALEGEVNARLLEPDSLELPTRKPNTAPS